MGQSGCLVGLPGAGKSNLVSFLGNRPDVVAQYMENTSLKVATILVDLNNLPRNNLATFYRVLLRALHEAGTQLSALDQPLFEKIETLYRKVEDKTDPFLTQSAYRETLQVFQSHDIRLALVLDPFDTFCRTAPTRLLDNLRGLRDGFKTTLSYIVGLRHDLAYVRDPAEIGELYDILDTHVCRVGPLTEGDARLSIAQVEEVAGRSFREAEIRHLLELCGGYPALLRAASLWLADVAPAPPFSQWEECLLQQPAMRNRLDSIWQALTSEEQAALSVLQSILSGRADRVDGLRQFEQKYASVLARLQTKYVCLPADAGFRLFSPLLARYVSDLQGVIAGKIWSEGDRFYRDDLELSDLSELDRRLLRHFLRMPLSVRSLDQLKEAAWLEDNPQGVSSEAIQQAVRHLRTRIELDPSQPRYLVTLPKAGYRFFPDGEPASVP